MRKSIRTTSKTVIELATAQLNRPRVIRTSNDCTGNYNKRRVTKIFTEENAAMLHATWQVICTTSITGLHSHSTRGYSPILNHYGSAYINIYIYIYFFFCYLNSLTGYISGGQGSDSRSSLLIL